MLPPGTSTDPSAASRRGFLQRFAGAAAIGTAAPLAAVAVTGDLYVNHRMGVAFRKPSGWRYEHLRTFADIHAEYEYARVDPQTEKELRAGPLPVVVASQSGVLTNLCASFTLYVEPDPLPANETLESAADDIVRGVSSFVKSFKLLGPPVFKDVSGRRALDFRFTFLYEDRLGNKGLVRHRSLAIRGGTLLYTFNMLDIPADMVDAQAEFTGVEHSIVLA